MMKDGVGRFSGYFGIYNAGEGTSSDKTREENFANLQV